MPLKCIPEDEHETLSVLEGVGEGWKCERNGGRYLDVALVDSGELLDAGSIDNLKLCSAADTITA